MFCRYALRTTDVDGARRFYREAIGLEIPRGKTAEHAALEAWPLHERARANGAPAHWLGHLASDDVESMSNRLVDLGGERLGPTVQAADGAAFATLRDPSGAVIAVRAARELPTNSPVVWHQLHARDADRAWAAYSELFGWTQTTTVEAADPVGGHRIFGWNRSAKPVGSIANTARWAGVHTHWLFYWSVNDLDSALGRVRALGGKALEPVEFPTVGRVSACDDPQGAAFGLLDDR